MINEHLLRHRPDRLNMSRHAGRSRIRFALSRMCLAAYLCLFATTASAQDLARLLDFVDMCSDIIVDRAVSDQDLVLVDTHNEAELRQSAVEDIRLIVGPAGPDSYGCIIFINTPPTRSRREALTAEFLAWADAQRDDDNYYVGTCAGPCVVDVGLETCASDNKPVRIDAIFPGSFGLFGIDVSRNARNEFWFKSC